MDEFRARRNCKNRRVTDGKSRFLQEADCAKFTADAAAELLEIALIFTPFPAYSVIRPSHIIQSAEGSWSRITFSADAGKAWIYEKNQAFPSMAVKSAFTEIVIGKVTKTAR